MATAPIDRVLARVRKTSNGCWIWQGAKDRDGYGVIRTGSRTKGDRRMRFVHELSAEHYKREKAAGPNVEWHHTCGNRACVNPNHLERVTKQQNLAARRY